MPLYRQPKSPYWFVRFTVGGVKVRRSTGTTSREAAEEFETKLRTDLWRQVRLGERPAYTWAQAVKRWYLEAEGRGKEQDHDKLKWFAQYLDTTVLTDINRDLIEKMRTLRRGESSPSTANRYMALVRMILRKAHRDWDWIERAPVVPMFRIEKQEPRFLTRAQFALLKRKLSKQPHLAAVAEFSVETGLRMRNVTGLQWSQVDLVRRLVIIPASRAKSGETIAVPLSAGAVRILKAQEGKHESQVFTHKKGPKGRALAFEDANGAVFKEAAAAAGVPWLRWHDLRHTWASWHIQSGTPPHVLQLLGGWKSYAMVQRYGHLTADHLLAFAEHGKGIPRKQGASK
jgi:integrase